MSFELKNVVPWGRNPDEYKQMFNLTEADLGKKILGIGDGPASFNSSMTKEGRHVISIDPLYQFRAAEIETRIAETKEIILTQMRGNLDKFAWTSIKSIEALESIRTAAMEEFLEDYETGRRAGRYIFHTLPEPIHFSDGAFELGLSSHFLILYAQLGVDFHIRSITEMLKVCNEIRIFPLVNLDARKSEVLEELVHHFGKGHTVLIENVNYEFQKGGNQMLKIYREQ